MSSRAEILSDYVHSPEYSQYADKTMQKFSDAGVDIVCLHRMICGSTEDLTANEPFAIYSLIFAMSLENGQFQLAQTEKRRTRDPSKCGILRRRL